MRQSQPNLHVEVVLGTHPELSLDHDIRLRHGPVHLSVLHGPSHQHSLSSSHRDGDVHHNRPQTVVPDFDQACGGQGDLPDIKQSHLGDKDSCTWSGPPLGPETVLHTC